MTVKPLWIPRNRLRIDEFRFLRLLDDMCKIAHGGFALWLQSRHLFPANRAMDEFAANSEGAKLQPYALLCFFERFIGGQNGYDNHGFNTNDGGIWLDRILLLVKRLDQRYLDQHQREPMHVHL